ncbi:BLUF domain-containing protein [Paracoccus aestuariivivens]|uniref:BLUF domain-containing protein n=1 Tax=Paracoccus aestuariivivens TaxID=1820333 RepID=UPI0012BAD6BF|nr:BLUF domain-containing protein [Paracoccus aestuariivivens]
METAFFLYRSRTELTARSTQCADILHEARTRNLELGLTGYLHLEDGRFYQWLEGPALPLDDVGQMIVRDQRHRDVEFLWRGNQTERRFPNWQMGFGTSSAGTLFDYVADQGIQVSDLKLFATGLLQFMQFRFREKSG